MIRRTHTSITDLYGHYQDLMGEVAAARSMDELREEFHDRTGGNYEHEGADFLDDIFDDEWAYGDAVSLEVMANDEWIRVFSSVDFEYVDEMDEEDAASTFVSALVDALEDSGFDVAYAKGQRSPCDGWQGFNLFRHKIGPVGTFSELSDSETGKIHAALDHAADVMHSKWTKQETDDYYTAETDF